MSEKYPEVLNGWNRPLVLARGSWRNHMICLGGDAYIPYNSSPVSAGPFLATRTNSVDSYLKVTKFRFGIKDRRIAGIPTFRKGLAAFKFYGDSMTGDDIRHGDTGIFELTDLENIRLGKPALVEKVGDEEGTGSWALKRIVIPRPRSYVQNQWGEPIDWDDPIIELRSSNPCIHPWRLDPNQQYRVRGYFVRVLRPEEVESIVLPDGTDGWPKSLQL